MQGYLEIKDHPAIKEYLVEFNIFDRVPVKVDTTVEFPLDIKCGLVLSKKDTEQFEEAERKQKEAADHSEGDKKLVLSVLEEDDVETS